MRLAVDLRQQPRQRRTHHRHVLRQHRKPERHHPESEDRQKAEHAAGRQRDADRNAIGLRRRLRTFCITCDTRWGTRSCRRSSSSSRSAGCRVRLCVGHAGIKARQHAWFQRPQCRKDYIHIFVSTYPRPPWAALRFRRLAPSRDASGCVSRGDRGRWPRRGARCTPLARRPKLHGPGATSVRVTGSLEATP